MLFKLGFLCDCFDMKQTLAMISITAALIFGSIGAVVAADFDAGFAAYQKGDYALALREWTPLAEQGDAGAQLVLGGCITTDTALAKMIKQRQNGSGLPPNRVMPLPNLIWGECTLKDKVLAEIMLPRICGPMLRQ